MKQKNLSEAAKDVVIAFTLVQKKTALPNPVDNKLQDAFIL